MDKGLKAHHLFRYRRAFQVSILVIMDKGLKEIKTAKEGVEYQGFNPCYNG